MWSNLSNLVNYCAQSLVIMISQLSETVTRTIYNSAQNWNQPPEGDHNQKVKLTLGWPVGLHVEIYCLITASAVRYRWTCTNKPCHRHSLLLHSYYYYYETAA